MTLEDLLMGPDHILLTIHVETFVVSVQDMAGTTVEHGPFASWEVMCAAYPGIWAETVAPFGGADAFYSDTSRPVAPLDLAAARVREERREAVRATVDSSAWRTRMEAARQLLRDEPLPPAALQRVNKDYRRDIDLSPEALASSLTYALEIEGYEGEPAVGSSKRGGLPDLPPDLEWPKVEGLPTALVLQVSFAELAAADVSGSCPKDGMLYVFVANNGHGTVRFAPTSEGLARRACAEVPEYLEDLLTREERVRFVPGFYFDQTSDTGGPYAVTRALGPLEDRLAEIIGGRGLKCFGRDRVFGGDPVDWQSMGASYLEEELFCQLGFGEGHVSVGVHAMDLAGSWFGDADVGYCGT